MNIINRMNQGASIRNLCAEYGISRITLYRWLNNYSKPDPSKGNIPTVKNYNMLQRKVEKLENLDLFSHMVIAHKVSRKNSAQLITATFKMACELRKPEAGFIFHSDRGAQYASHRFQQLLHEQACIQPFSNSGKTHDNAVSESFFASLKKEELYRKDYSSEATFSRE